jgi:hypothetical protein
MNVARCLGDEFEVVLSVGEGEVSRPFARVTAATPIASTPHGSRHVDLIQGYAIIAFPTIFPITPEAAMSEARRVERLLRDGFTAGIETEHFRKGRRHPLRIPIYDYETSRRDRRDRVDRMAARA